MPDFWSAFVLVTSERYKGRTQRVMETLNSPDLKNYIRYAELNRYTHEDDDCPPNDGFWNWQGNLHKITYQGQEFNAHINMEPGWCVETGSSNLKVAVMDSGLFWAHEDYGDGTFDGCVVDGGFNYDTDEEISADANNDDINHGTRVTGLIGAIRNNDIGVGAIAGGDDGMGGVRLYAYKVFGVPVSDLYAGYERAIEHDEVDVINTSGGLYVNDNGLTSSQQMFREHIHFANRLGIIQIGSMGNDGIEYGSTQNIGGVTINNIARYPGMTQDEWVLSVGASGLNGQYEEYSNFGEIVDVVAPANWQLNRTTSNNPANFYEGISLTSGATPNVSGLASLLASH